MRTEKGNMEEVGCQGEARPKYKMHSTEDDSDGFGQFLIGVKNVLTTENIRMLTTAMEFKPAERDKVEISEDPGHVFVHALKEKGVINQTNISALIQKLKFCGLQGVADDVNKSFTRYQSGVKTQGSKAHDYEDKKSNFKQQLRNKYKKLCGSIQPVPFLHDRYDIAEIFIQSEIKVFIGKQEGKNDHEQWTTLKDYKAIFTNPLVRSNRRIIDGEPGVGKSTLGLQIANDWCQGKPPLNDVEILIHLQLRQFKNVTNIFAGIRKFLLPKDSTLTEDDIKNILDNSSTLFWLDGYDEYPDRRKDEETDIDDIIRGDMFQEYDVVLTTRTSCFPPDYPPETPRIRVIGFDNTARNMYIQNVVGRGNPLKCERIRQFFSKNPVPTDLCVLPLFFVMISHMVQERKAFQSLYTVTEVFRRVFECFLSHEQIREEAAGKRGGKRLVRDHSKLDKIVFEGLSGDPQKITWSRKELRDKIEDELYDEYVRVGIFIEEEFFDDDTIDYKTETRFCHKLFLEWHAAHYLAKEAALQDVEFEAWSPNKLGFWFAGIRHQAANKLQDQDVASSRDCKLKNLDPYREQYVYRFACGLNPDAAIKIIEHLGKKENFDECLLLCMPEWGGSFEGIGPTINGLCSRPIRIKDYDGFLLQKSSVKLLETASKQKVHIFRLCLVDCLDISYLSVGDFRLKKSNLTLPNVMPTLTELFILEAGIKIAEEEIGGIFKYISKCTALNRMYFQHCMLPRYITVNQYLSVLKSRDVKVGWHPGSKVHLLNLESGQWEQGLPSSFGHLFSGWFKLWPMTDEDYDQALKAFSWIREDQQRREQKRSAETRKC